MNYTEQGLVFECQGESLVGVLAVPEQAQNVGVVIIVGGPQYRIGSHRQFVLLARNLAENGFPCLRFDNRSMGDATGETRDFEDIGPDLAAAVSEFFAALPDVQHVVLLGLCGGASAACVYAPEDDRIKGLLLLNPWVRTAESQAKAYLKHYYADRLRDPAFWKKLFKGKIGVASALTGVARTARKAIGKTKVQDPQSERNGAGSTLMERMLYGVERSCSSSLVVLSGRDYVARECDEVLIPHPRFKDLAVKGRVRVMRVDEADHTFTMPGLQQELERITVDFVRSLSLDVGAR
ncbi:hydrolase 1, exosortase A system-associated [Thauera sp.]|uniref:hydrolase 1, exosortase A system-associated n=1 Tax=Thauera sp. TaxID=1905334 RepID=UPI0039E4186D